MRLIDADDLINNLVNACNNDQSKFRDLIAEIPDLIYIPCDFGTEGIFFTSEDLNKARYQRMKR